MKIFKLIFTMIVFAAFGMAADAKAEKLAVPCGVESQTDPPDCCVSITAKQESQEHFNITPPNFMEVRSTATYNSTQCIHEDITTSRFGRLCSTADGGCGRLCGLCFDSDTNSTSSMAPLNISG